MKKIFIQTFAFSILLFIGVSCSMMEEPDMPEKNAISNIDATDYELAHKDSLFKAFSAKSDSIFANDTIFVSINTSRSLSTITKTSKRVNIEIDYLPDGNEMVLTIPVSEGRFWYTALKQSCGLPISPIEFFAKDGDRLLDQSIDYKDKGKYVEIHAKVEIEKRFLGVAYDTVGIGYVICVNVPYAQINEYR